MNRYGEKQRKPDAPDISGIQLLSATAYQLKKPYQQLLIPITVWIGMEQAFIGAEFTQVRLYNDFIHALVIFRPNFVSQTCKSSSKVDE